MKYSIDVVIKLREYANTEIDKTRNNAIKIAYFIFATSIGFTFTNYTDNDKTFWIVIAILLIFIIGFFTYKSYRCITCSLDMNRKLIEYYEKILRELNESISDTNDMFDPFPNIDPSKMPDFPIRNEAYSILFSGIISLVLIISAIWQRM